MVTSAKLAPLELALDVGHSSIGWSVLTPGRENPEILGCGVVLFEKDSALANQRRLHRQQRRHVRATRLRIARIEKLLAHIGALPVEELTARHRAAAGHSAPWLLAARVLASNGERTLTWNELWDVLRWYAHNRGYEELGERQSVDRGEEEAEEDAEKVANAKAAMERFGKHTMAETICAWLGIDPLGERSASTANYKRQNCAFERPVVQGEVRRILIAHIGRLTGLDATLVRALLDDAAAVAVPVIRLPRRYRGGLLFGRLATRYDNRIIGLCPVSGGKLPLKRCAEFLRFRWAMQLANVRVAGAAGGDLRPLDAAERARIHAEMMDRGSFAPGELKRTIREIACNSRDNLDQLLVHPDAKEALVFDPVRKLITHDAILSRVWAKLPSRTAKRFTGQWRRGRSFTLQQVLAAAETNGLEATVFKQAIAEHLATLGKSRRKTPLPTRDELLAGKLSITSELQKLSGRAPYTRPLLAKAFDEVLAGKDPRASGGCLEETTSVRQQRESRAIDRQTNNHLVRHRLLVLGRLLRDIIVDPLYGNRDASRIDRITIEVNRDLRTMAGLTAQEIAKELGARLASHERVSERLERELPAEKISASLIRKARVADDLGWKCPYTGADFEPKDLLTRRVDKDHIIPRSLRPSDALDSLALTFTSVNKWKGQRTAWQFVQEEGGKTVPDDPRLTLVTSQRFKTFVDRLDTRGHSDDRIRKKRRKELLLIEHFEEREREFLPGQLTVTSQLARLAAQTVRTPFSHLPRQPQAVALPGLVTAAARRAWNLLGCLSAANPDVLEADGTAKTKTEIRNITHLHHALDACVLALTAHLLPNRGDLWRALAQRRVPRDPQQPMRATGMFDFDTDGGWRLRDLPAPLKEQIRARLAELRVVQHIPADMGGLRVEENTRGIEHVDADEVRLRQRAPDGLVKRTVEAPSKLLGLRTDGSKGKLAALHGVRVITDNFGVAILADEKLPPAERFVIIPWHRVWQRLQDLTARNGGKRPKIWRNGRLIQLSAGQRKGAWRIFSIKNNASGMALDLGTADAIRPIWINVLLKSLLRDGAELVLCKLTGSR